MNLAMYIPLDKFLKIRNYWQILFPLQFQEFSW